MENNQNSILHGFTPESLSRLITDAIVGGSFKTKGDVRRRVEELIKVFIRFGTNGKALNKSKYQFAVKYETRQKVFWHRKMKELHPRDIEQMYKELEDTLISEGFKPVKEDGKNDNRLAAGL